MSVADEKADLRKMLRARRSKLKRSGEHAAQSKAACDHLLRAIAALNPKVVASYMASGSELDLKHFHTLAADFMLCLPVVTTSLILSFHQFSYIEALMPGPHGILEPNQQMPVLIPDLVFVPLLGFDTHGRRLGQGGGYYDVTLAALRQQNPSLFAIGVGFLCQEVEGLPSEEHDATLDAIATQDGITYA